MAWKQRHMYIGDCKFILERCVLNHTCTNINNCSIWLSYKLQKLFIQKILAYALNTKSCTEYIQG